MKNLKETKVLTDSLDVYESKKSFALKGLIISFIVWQVGQIIERNFEEFITPSILLIFQLFILLGALGWAGFMFYLIKVSRFLKGNSELNKQVDDERMSLIRLRSMSYGFMITLGITALFFGASTLFDSFSESFTLSGTFIAQSIILVAVSSAGISYLVLDKEE